MIQTVRTKLGSPSALRPHPASISTLDAELWQGGHSRVGGRREVPPCVETRDAWQLPSTPASRPRLQARGGSTHSAATAPKRCWAPGPGSGRWSPGALGDPAASPEACVLMPSSSPPLPPFPDRARPPWPCQRPCWGPAGRYLSLTFRNASF